MENENVKIEIKGTKAILTIDLSKDLGDSVSGKSTLIAKCREQVTGGTTVAVNVYKKKKS